MYKIDLILGEMVCGIPVLPEKLAVKSPGKNETAEVIGLGEVGLLRFKGLRTVSWESFFPANHAPYVDQPQIVSPLTYVRAFQLWRDKRIPVQLVITGTDLDINLTMSIESFDYEERFGEVGDLYYSIGLREWKDKSPRKVTLSAGKVTAQTERPGGQEKPKTITVAPGNSLWSLAKKYYNDGARYASIYSANKSVIDARNKGHVISKYMIYPGQVLKLP